MARYRARAGEPSKHSAHFEALYRCLGSSLTSEAAPTPIQVNSPHKWDEQVALKEDTVPMKKSAPHLITEVPRRRTKAETTIGIDLGDVWSHYCTLNQDGEVVKPWPLQDYAEGD